MTATRYLLMGSWSTLWPDDLPPWIVENLSKDGKHDNQIKRKYTYELADKLTNSVRDRHKLALKLGVIGTPTTPPTNNDIVFALGGRPVEVAEEMIEKCPVGVFTLINLADKVHHEHKIAKTSVYWYWPGCTYEEFMRACDRTNSHLYPQKGNLVKGDALALEVVELIGEDGIFCGFESVRTDNKIINNAHNYLCESTSSTYKFWADKGTELLAIEAGLAQYKKEFGRPLDYYPSKSWLDQMNIPEQSRSLMNVEAITAVVNDTSIQGQIGASEEGATIDQDSREIQPENQGGHLGNVDFNEDHQNDDPPPLNRGSVNNNQLLRHRNAHKNVYDSVDEIQEVTIPGHTWVSHGNKSISQHKLFWRREVDNKKFSMLKDLETQITGAIFSRGDCDFDCDVVLVNTENGDCYETGYRTFDNIMANHVDTWIHYYDNDDNPNKSHLNIQRLPLLIWHTFRHHKEGQVSKLLRAITTTEMLESGMVKVVTRYDELGIIQSCELIKTRVNKRARNKMKHGNFSKELHWGAQGL